MLEKRNGMPGGMGDLRGAPKSDEVMTVYTEDAESVGETFVSKGTDENAVSISKPEAAGQTENGTAEEATGKDISGWANYEDTSAVTFTLNGIAAYRTAGESKAMPGFDVIDYGQEDYVFGSREKDARHWNTYLLEIFEKYVDVLEPLFNGNE